MRTNKETQIKKTGTGTATRKTENPTDTVPYAELRRKK